MSRAARRHGPRRGPRAAGDLLRRSLLPLLANLYADKPAAAIPAKAAAPVSTSSSPLAGTLQLECDTRGNCKVVGGANDRFTVIYGANADAVAQQIQSFADSEATGKQLAALLASSTSADVFERTVAADQNTEQAKKSAAALAKELKALVDELGKDSVTAAADGDAARRILLQAAQNAIKRAGASTTIDKTNVDTGLTQAKAAYEVLSK